MRKQVRAGEDADVEVGVELIEPAAAFAAIVEMPEGNLLRMRRERTQSALADQVVAGIADVAQLLEKLLLRLRLLLPLRIGDGQAVGAIGKARVVTRNARHENSWTHSTRPFCFKEAARQSAESPRPRDLPPPARERPRRATVMNCSRTRSLHAMKSEKEEAHDRRAGGPEAALHERSEPLAIARDLFDDPRHLPHHLRIGRSR